MSKQLGKIESVRFGNGGYQDCQLGYTFRLASPGSGVFDFWGTWGTERSEYTKWTEEDRLSELGKCAMKVKTLLDEAEVQNLEDLVGKPIEIEYSGNALISWRILKEIL